MLFFVLLLTAAYTVLVSGWIYPVVVSALGAFDQPGKGGCVLLATFFSSPLPSCLPVSFSLPLSHSPSLSLPPSHSPSALPPLPSHPLIPPLFPLSPSLPSAATL